MSAREAADTLRIVLPFAAALVELGDKIETLAGLDGQLEETTRKLAAAKKEHAIVKDDAETAKIAAQQARQDADQYVADRKAEIEAQHKQSMDEIAAARSNADMEAKSIRDQADTDARDKLAAAETTAAETIAKAHANAEAIQNEHADLTAKTVQARADYAEASKALEEINARLDNIRRS